MCPFVIDTQSSDYNPFSQVGDSESDLPTSGEHTTPVTPGSMTPPMSPPESLRWDSPGPGPMSRLYDSQDDRLARAEREAQAQRLERVHARQRNSYDDELDDERSGRSRRRRLDYDLDAGGRSRSMSPQRTHTRRHGEDE